MDLIGRVCCDACQQQHPLFVTFNAMINWSEGLLALNRIVAIAFPLKFRALNRNSISILRYFVVGFSFYYSRSRRPSMWEQLIAHAYRDMPIGTAGRFGTKTFG